MNDERGVSDLVAFVLMFGIIIMSVATVYMFGFDNIRELRDGEQVRSIDRTMEGVSDTIADVHRENAPSRTIAVGLDGGTISVTEKSQLTIVVNTTSGNMSYPVDTGALVFRPNDKAEMVYEGGITYRTQDSGQYVLSDPVISCDGETAIVDVPRVTGRLSLSAPGTIELTGRHVSEQSLYPSAGQLADNATAVEIQIDETRNPDAWRQYFETSPDGWTETSDGYRCSGLNGVSVQTTTISLHAIY